MAAFCVCESCLATVMIIRVPPEHSLPNTDQSDKRIPQPDRPVRQQECTLTPPAGFAFKLAMFDRMEIFRLKEAKSVAPTLLIQIDLPPNRPAEVSTRYFRLLGCPGQARARTGELCFRLSGDKRTSR